MDEMENESATVINNVERDVQTDLLTNMDKMEEGSPTINNNVYKQSEKSLATTEVLELSDKEGDKIDVLPVRKGSRSELKKQAVEIEAERNVDMFVVEAPSLIVPCLYVKPPIKPLRQFVNELSMQDKSEEVNSFENGDKDKESDINTNMKKKTKTAKTSKFCGDEDYSWEDDSSDPTEISISDEESIRFVKDDILVNPLKNAPILKTDSYFDTALGNFFMDIGNNLVQEYVEKDMLKNQKKKLLTERKIGHVKSSTKASVSELTKHLKQIKEKNAPYLFPLKKCSKCSFKSNSAIVLADHMEKPHVKNKMYKCNDCTFQNRSMEKMLSHMREEHGFRGCLEELPAAHQCVTCPYENTQKAKVQRHIVSCAKKFNPDVNLAPPVDWDPPAKIPMKATSVIESTGSPGAGSAAKANTKIFAMPTSVIMSTGSPGVSGAAKAKASGSAAAAPPQVQPDARSQASATNPAAALPLTDAPSTSSGKMNRTIPELFKYQFAQIRASTGPHTSKPVNQISQNLGRPSPVPTTPPASTATNPKLAVTPPVNRAPPLPPKAPPLQPKAPLLLSRAPPLPSRAPPLPSRAPPLPSRAPPLPSRAPPLPSRAPPLPPRAPPLPPRAPQQHRTAQQHRAALPPRAPLRSEGLPPWPRAHVASASYVVCEICDGYISNEERLRDHLYINHNVIIYPWNSCYRPPIGCQICLMRFYTDLGLQRHMLGKHGVVNMAMQELAAQGRDAGRCPICGREVSSMLLAHVTNGHGVTLKTGNFLYQCMQCASTFIKYTEFEQHVLYDHDRNEPGNLSD